jgi:dipeptidase
VKAGDKPLHTIMWTALGYPACAVAVPLLMHKDHLPAYMKARNEHAKEGKQLNAEICDKSLQIKNEWAFPLHISNGNRYIALRNILCDQPHAPSLLSCVHSVERSILTAFEPLYAAWCRGEISDKEFYQQYQQCVSVWFEQYKETFANYIL